MNWFRPSQIAELIYQSIEPQKIRIRFNTVHLLITYSKFKKSCVVGDNL